MQRRALVVDYEPAVSELLKTVLNSHGLEALILDSCREAPVALQKEKFDVVFLGFRKPSQDGVELTRQIRRSGFNQRTPIVIMSDDQNPAALSDGFAAGASFFLYKPVDKAHLVKLVRATRGTVEQERRRFRRISVQSRVQLKFNEGECVCETIDVSLNGMLVAAPITFPKGAIAHFRLHLRPGMKPIEGSGLVMRTIGPNKMGIQFQDLDRAESSRLQEFLLPLISVDDPVPIRRSVEDRRLSRIEY